MNDLKTLFGNAVGFRLFFNETDSDVSIIVNSQGNKCHYPAHKLVLCTMSEVFRTMFEVDMIESKTRVITISDSNPYAVKQFLRYMYMGVVDFNNWSEALNLLKIAHKYGVQTLTNLCEAYLTSNIFFNNVCELYEIGRTYSLRTLKKCTKDFILEAGFIVSFTEGFFNLKARSLEYFISSPTFNMENEGTVLNCLREWAVCECSRNCVPLTRLNVLAAMEPYLKYIHWNLIPEYQRTFIPTAMVDNAWEEIFMNRKTFRFPALLQYHLTFAKFILELGTYHDQKSIDGCSLTIVKYSIDNHMFLVGFRIVGLFKMQSSLSIGPFYLILGREDGKVFVQFNLNSLPWTTGAVDGNYVWREMIAYLPYPIRIDPFNTYMMSLKSSRPCKIMQSVKWPKTRLDTENLCTNLGSFQLRSIGTTYGLTQLFMLPAAAYRSICNRSPND